MMPLAIAEVGAYEWFIQEAVRRFTEQVSFMSYESEERRQYPRMNLSQVVRIRPFDPTLPPEYCTTFNVSRNGLYFATQAGYYTPGMSVYVTSDFQPDSPLNHTVAGAVIRIDKLDADQWGVAIQIFSPSSATVN